MMYLTTHRCIRSVSAACLIAVAPAASGTASANEPEQFKANPNVFDDAHSVGVTQGSDGLRQYEIVQGFAVFEGDILLGTVDQDGHLIQNLRYRGLGRSDTFCRWPDGIVPFEFPDTASDIQRQNVRDAIDHWMNNTSVKFVERTTDNESNYPNFLRFDTGNGCASFVGMQGGEQSVMLSDACKVGSIIHELGHAVGLFHEHTRPDRDSYVTIRRDHIFTDKNINFDILDAGVAQLGEYDYGSIMHYGEYFFSRTGERTIAAPDGIKIGQRDALSQLDVEAVENMYATDLAVQYSQLQETTDGLEFTVDVTNLGLLGAHDLTLRLAIANNSIWTGISANSGWDCLAYGAELRCVREQLAQSETSSFTLLVDPGTGTSADLAMRLDVATRDMDFSNNQFNDQSKFAALEGSDESDTPVVQDEPPLTSPDESEPETGAASPVTIVPESDTVGGFNGGAAGAGAAGYAFLVTGLLIVLRRKLL